MQMQVTPSARGILGLYHARLACYLAIWSCRFEQRLRVRARVCVLLRTLATAAITASPNRLHFSTAGRGVTPASASASAIGSDQIGGRRRTGN
jgi:hypothetical protein